MVENDLFSESLRILVREQEDEKSKDKKTTPEDEEKTKPKDKIPVEDEVEEKVPDEMPEPTDEESFEEEEIDPKMIGKIYELKKIHQKLVSISNMIDHFASADFEDLRNYVNKGLELFNIVTDNFAVFKDNIDILISDYYRFLERVVEKFEKLTKKLENEKEGE